MIDLGELIYCPACEDARTIDVDTIEIMVLEQEKPIRVKMMLSCAGCGTVLP